MHPPAEPHIWNGHDFVPCPGVPATDRGFRYGMSFFESLAVRRGRVEFLDAHLERLAAACRQCGWPVYTTALKRAGEWLTAWAEALANENASAFARIYVTAGDGGAAAPVQAPRVLVFVEPREATEPKPLRIVLRSAPHVPTLGGLKTANYWAQLEALGWARHAGFDEALLFNPDGLLISACMANVFVLLGREWITPHPATGARAGVVREWVMRQLAPGKIVQRPLTIRDLDHASACFLTSSWNGVMPIASLDMRALQTAEPDAIRQEWERTTQSPFA